MLNGSNGVFPPKEVLLGFSTMGGNIPKKLPKKGRE